MIDLLNELVSGTPSDQSQLKIDLVEELERLRREMDKLEKEISHLQFNRSINQVDID